LGLNNENPTQRRKDAESAKDYENNEKIEIKKISNAVNFCVLFAFALDFMML